MAFQPGARGQRCARLLVFLGNRGRHGPAGLVRDLAPPSRLMALGFRAPPPHRLSPLRTTLQRETRALTRSCPSSTVAIAELAAASAGEYPDDMSLDAPPAPLPL